MSACFVLAVMFGLSYIGCNVVRDTASVTREAMNGHECMVVSPLSFVVVPWR